MTTKILQHKFTPPPRSSTATERWNLLQPDSLAPSETASFVTVTDLDRTQQAHSPAPRHPFRLETEPAPSSRPYRGFPSEAHYLAALRAWAESKQYAEPFETGLVGFYGTKTMGELASKQPPTFEGLRLKEKWRARRERKKEAAVAAAGSKATIGEEWRRRSTVA